MRTRFVPLIRSLRGIRCKRSPFLPRLFYFPRYDTVTYSARVTFPTRSFVRGVGGRRGKKKRDAFPRLAHSLFFGGGGGIVEKNAALLRKNSFEDNI